MSVSISLYPKFCREAYHFFYNLDQQVAAKYLLSLRTAIMKDPNYSCKENSGILPVKESDVTKDEQEILHYIGGYLIMKAVKKFQDDKLFICKLKSCQVTSLPGLLSLLEKNSSFLYPQKNFL